MNPVESERIINRVRYIFVFFFLLSGIVAYKSGSAFAVYGSIITIALFYSYLYKSHLYQKKHYSS